MPPGVPTASDALPDVLAIAADATGSAADDRHVTELVAALSAQTDPRWRLVLLARRGAQAAAWQAIVDTQPGWLRDRLSVGVRHRWRRRVRCDLRIRVDDVPLAHLVETIHAHGGSARLRVAVQDAYRVRWPSGTSGWSLSSPPSPGRAISVGRRGRTTADVVLLRRRWVRRPSRR